MSEEALMGKAVLVGIVTSGFTEAEIESNLDELDRLLDTAGGITFARVVQKKEYPDPKTLIGSGKVGEISCLCETNGISLVIFDVDLSPVQIRNLEDGIGHDVRVIDRSMLILDIFALHAVTGEGKVQVELAQLRYTAPRLSGHGKEMSRLGGGIGTRGPGESKLELDKRHIERRISALESELKELAHNRKTMRATRDKSDLTQIAIVGYTNAGKSTLLNCLTNAGILAEDKLFATLDTTTRQLTLPSGKKVLLTDTVGFIRHLPHHLIEAFKSTLEEAVFADILLVVIDSSDEEWQIQLRTTCNLLEDLGAGNKPTLYVFNKWDQCKISLKSTFLPVPPTRQVYISAKTGYGVNELLEKIQIISNEGKYAVTMRIPVADTGVINTLYKKVGIENIEYGNEYVTVKCMIDTQTMGKMQKYIVWRQDDTD